MSPPDLKDPIERAAYRRELLGVARGVRRSGVALAVVGAGLLVAPRFGWFQPPLWLAYGVVGIAVMLMITGITARTRYHSRRMRD